MKYITYSLINGQNNSDLYYEKVNILSKKVITVVLNDGNKYIDDFIRFLNENDIENPRSKEEYGIELLLIGVFLQEYLSYGRAFKNKSKGIFIALNTLREREILKKKVDIIRGKLCTRILLNRKEGKDEVTLQDFKNIISWLEATGDFNEEIYRLNNWVKFLEAKGYNYSREVCGFSIEKSNYLYKESKYYIGEYTSNVKDYLKLYKKKHLNKEDIIYCGKGEIQYFFNMVSAEIMNSVYKEKFLSCKEKKVFLPSCMRQVQKECLGEKSSIGIRCKGCTEECNVNKLAKLGRVKGFKVNIIPHETMLFKSKAEENNKVGIIGIACVLNLMSGGWKALRLGFKPQCVILDYCGCSNHWVEDSIMTSINVKILEKLL